MLFSSLVFLWFFLPGTVFLYFAVPGRTAKNAVLLAASLIFYAWGEPVYILLVILTVFLSYLAGIGLFVFKDRFLCKKAVAAVFILAELGILAYFKYFNFFAEAANRMTGHELAALRDIALPLGISFYTFQAITYVADTYRGKNPVQKNLFHLALYICLFPQILSGPIVKYHEIVSELTDRRESLSMTAYGIKRFTYGLAKKVLLANTFGQAADRIFSIEAGQLGTAAVWLAVLLYALQIYYDFSGYSDMAIGLGRMFGFRYAENFDYPYLSGSITEFWRRWHISLSSWFKEYLYFPLGGNRKGLNRTCLNLFIVFAATGLWHGASANFILWGLFHGFFIIAERFGLGRILEKNRYRPLNHIYTLAVVVLGWLLFRISDMGTARSLLRAMAVPTAGVFDVLIFANYKVLFLTIWGILFCGPIQAVLPGLKRRLYDEEHTDGLDILLMLVLLFLSTTVVVSGTYNAFIYFKF